ncbi:MAG: nidogen-like domain-containing protein, partial [Verrucomicrobiia bacterium]
GRAAFGVNWINVGYYQAKYDKLNSFQLVLIDRADRTNGDFDLEFNYAQIQWEAGDVSGGSDGQYVWGDIDDYHSPARAGYASASGLTFELNGSAVPHALLDTNLVTGLIYTNFNSSVLGKYVFQFHNGIPLGTP